MKKILSILAKIVVGIVGVIILATVLFAVFFPQEKVRKIAVEQMQKQLHREVVLNKFHISLWRGIILKGVKISDYPNFKQGTFISCKAFVLKYDFWELLHKRFLLEALVVDTPEINVKRYRNSNEKVVFNFSDLLPSKKSKDSSKSKPKTKPQKKVQSSKTVSTNSPIPNIKSSQIPINIEIHELGLKKASIHIEDLATPKFKEIYSLNNVHFLLSDINLKQNKQMKISTGFGISVEEYKESQKTDKSINVDAEIAGKFILFDKTKKLNPEGTLSLQLANGKFHGLQLYKELVSQGQNLTKEAQDYQKEILASYDKIKKASQEAQNNKDVQKYAGKIGGTIDKAGAVVAKLDKLDMGFISKAMDIGFLKEDFTFDKLETELKIRDQKVISDNIVMNGKDVRGEGKGYTGFNKVIHYDFSLIGNKKYNSNLLTQSLANEKGEVVLPLLISGMISKPKVSMQGINLKTIMSKAAKEKLGPDGDILFGGTASIKEAATEKINMEKERLKKEAEAELKKKKEELQRKAEEEKRKAEEEAKKKAAEAAKKKLEESGLKIPKF